MPPMYHVNVQMEFTAIHRDGSSALAGGQIVSSVHVAQQMDNPADGFRAIAAAAGADAPCFAALDPEPQRMGMMRMPGRGPPGGEGADAAATQMLCADAGAGAGAKADLFLPQTGHRRSGCWRSRGRWTARGARTWRWWRSCRRAGPRPPARP